MPVDRPTFSESWYRVAELRPRLRPTVQIHRQHFRGQTWHVVQDPSNNQFFRLNDAAYRFVALLDGRRNVAEVWKLCNEQLGDNAPTQNEAIQLLGQLFVSNLLLSEVPADTQSLFNRYSKRVRREVQGYLMNLLFIRIPLIDPDHFLNRWVGLFGKLFSMPGMILWAMIVVIGLYHVGGRIGELWDMASMYGAMEGILSMDNLPLLYACFAVVKVCHEFGHAFACKRFGRQEGSGGEVHVMGIMFLVFAPFPYVDASSSWAFRSKWRRIVVGAGGMIVELIIASIAAVIWANTDPSSVANKLAYNVMFVAGVSTLLFNGNPLLRYDGYYILSDLLEIPNLAQRSKQYLYYLVRKYAWGVKQARQVAHTRGEKAWMVGYGIASTIYRVFICAAILLFIADQLFMLGAVLAVAATITWVFVPLGKFVHYLATSGELHRVRSRAVVSTVVVLGGVVGGLTMIPAPDYIEAVGVAEPTRLMPVYASGSGFVPFELDGGGLPYLPTDSIVRPGQVLLVTRDREREIVLDKLLKDVQDLESKEKAAQYEFEKRELRKKIEFRKKDVQSVRDELARLDIRAPAEIASDGLAPSTAQALAPSTGESPGSGGAAMVWVSPNIDRLRNAYITKGDAVGTLASLDDMVIRVVATQDVPLADLLDDVRIRAKGNPDIEQGGRIIQKLSAARQDLPSPALGYAAGGDVETDPQDKEGVRALKPFFEVRVRPDRPQDLRPMQRVVVRMRLPDKPLAHQWWRMLQQLVQKKFHV